MRCKRADVKESTAARRRDRQTERERECVCACTRSCVNLARVLWILIHEICYNSIDLVRWIDSRTLQVALYVSVHFHTTIKLGVSKTTHTRAQVKDLTLSTDVQIFPAWRMHIYRAKRLWRLWQQINISESKSNLNADALSVSLVSVRREAVSNETCFHFSLSFFMLTPTSRDWFYSELACRAN